MALSPAGARRRRCAAMARERARRPGHRRRRRRRRVRRSTPPPAACRSAWSRPATAPSGTSSRSSKLIHGGLRYLEMLDFGLVREALRERGAAAQTGSRRTWCGRCRSSTRCSTASGSGSTSAPACCSTTRWRSGAPRRAPPPAPEPARRRCGSFPSLRKDALVGAIQYYDAPGRRRPAHDVRSPAPPRRTARSCASRRPGHRLPARGRPGRRRAGPRPRDRRGARASGPGRSSTRPACGPTTSRTLVGGRGQFHVTRLQGRAPASSRATGSSSHTGLILRTEKSVLFVIPWGRHWIIGTTDTDWDARQGAPGGQPVGHRLPARPGQRGAAHAADPRRRRRASTPACARCCPARPRTTSQAVPRARGRQPGARAGRGRRRQVHDVPGDGQGRRRRGRPRPGPRRCPTSVHRHGAAARRRGLRRRCGTPREPLAAARRPARRPGSSTCCSRYGSLVDELLALIAADPALAEPLAGAAGLPAGRGRLRGRRTRARCTSTTCCTRRTRISIETPDRGVGRGRGGRASWSRRSSAGTTSRSTREVEHYRAAGRGRARRPGAARRPHRRRRPSRGAGGADAGEPASAAGPRRGRATLRGSWSRARAAP